MTLDEAIEHCENVAAKCFAERSARNHSGKCGFEHLELAEWLRELKAYKEQEPCEDAISRKSVDALVDELARAISDERLRIPRGRSAGEIMQDIRNLPSVAPKQKTGEILTDYAIGIDINGFERRVKETTYCSLCKWDLGYNGDLLTHYCPNCGVKLEYKGR